jgi:hypothetical protein
VIDAVVEALLVGLCVLVSLVVPVLVAVPLIVAEKERERVAVSLPVLDSVRVLLVVAVFL